MQLLAFVLSGAHRSLVAAGPPGYEISGARSPGRRSPGSEWPVTAGSCRQQERGAHWRPSRVERSPTLRRAARGVQGTPASFAGGSVVGVAVVAGDATQAAYAGRGTNHQRPLFVAPGIVLAATRHALRRPTNSGGSSPRRVENGVCRAPRARLSSSSRIARMSAPISASAPSTSEGNAAALRPLTTQLLGVARLGRDRYDVLGLVGLVALGLVAGPSTARADGTPDGLCGVEARAQGVGQRRAEPPRGAVPLDALPFLPAPLRRAASYGRTSAFPVKHSGSPVSDVHEVVTTASPTRCCSRGALSTSWRTRSSLLITVVVASDER